MKMTGKIGFLPGIDWDEWPWFKPAALEDDKPIPRNKMLEVWRDCGGSTAAINAWRESKST